MKPTPHRSLLSTLSAMVLLIAILASCSDDDGGTMGEANLGYEYFPIDLGHYVVYKADSIWHDNPTAGSPGVHDTSSYYIKEYIESEFEDGAGEINQRLERYKRDEADQDWHLVDVWFIKRGSRNAQKVEENIRYIKMGFPIAQNSTWDGNALNDRDRWTYSYDSLYVEKVYGGESYPRTVTVRQRENKNFVEDELAYEVYAPDIGLVYRFYRELVTRLDYMDNPSAANIRSGVEFTWEIVDYGVE